MKRSLRLFTTASIVLVLFFGGISQAVFAAGGGGGGGGGAQPSAWDTSGSGPFSVTVTENIPWMSTCSQEKGGGPETKKYTCTVQGGFASVMDFLAGLIKYATFLTALLGVLMIVYHGLAITLSAGSDKERQLAKARIGQLIGGLVLLFLIAFVLNTVAPWVYK